MKYIKLIFLSLLFILPVYTSAHYTGRIMDHLARSDGKINQDPLGDFLNHRVNRSNQPSRSSQHHQVNRDCLGEFISRRGLTKPQTTRNTRQQQQSQSIANNHQTTTRDVLGELITKRTEVSTQQSTQSTTVARPAIQNLGNYNREVYSLALMMFYETGNRPRQEWLAVGNTTLNRLNHPEFPNTVHAIISQRGQYQWYHNHRLRGGRVFRPSEHPEIMATAAELYKQHLAGTRHDTTNGAIFFSSNGVRPAPRAVNPQRIGAHVFYRLRPLHRNRDI